MGILYLKEHTSCYNYAKYIREGFLYYENLKIETDEETDDTDCILFVIEGELELSCNGESLKLPAGHMVCFGRKCRCRMYSPGKVSMVIAQFDISVSSCERMSFLQLPAPEEAGERGMHPLEIRDRLSMFLKLLTGYLEDGANCIHFHEIKLKELFWNIRFYYTKTEQAAFFRPILGNDLEFRKKVLDNYRNARTVKELAYLCGQSLSTFKRSFSKEFREPASEWLQKQINSLIKYKLANDDSPIGVIADELHFSSQPQFCRYCKRNFGYTPGEWRELLKKRNTPPKRQLGRIQPDGKIKN